jgi:FkbM family methyltransferase
MKKPGKTEIQLKNLVKNLLNFSGYEIQKRNRPVGSDQRPIGKMPELLQDLRHRGLTCKTIIDVGANQTHWSVLAKNVFEDADLVMIEPQVEMKPYLEKFCRENGGSVYFLNGAGAKKEKLFLTVWDDFSGSSFMPEQDENLQRINKQREIEIITIDDLIQSGKIKMPEFIKLDIQGFELEALKGASTTFGKTEIYILEVSLYEFSKGMPIFHEVINFMFERGYVAYDFPGFLRRPLDGALSQCDICFVKKDGFLRTSKEWA